RRPGMFRAVATKDGPKRCSEYRPERSRIAGAWPTSGLPPVSAIAGSTLYCGHRTQMSPTAATLVLIGATGDLSQRMLLPSLFALHADRLLPPDLAIVGTARSDMQTESFRSLAAEAVAKHLPADRRPSGTREDFFKRLQYVALDASKPESFAALRERLGNGGTRTTAVLLSTAPSLFRPTIAGLHSEGLTGGRTRIALEKPLGHDLASFRDINDAVLAAFPEEHTFRIDHYLGKE